MPRRFTLSSQFLLLQLGIVAVVVIAVAGVSSVQTDASFRRSEGRRMLSSAETLASNDVVRQSVRSGSQPEALRAAAEVARAFADATYVIVTDGHGKILSATVPQPTRYFVFGKESVVDGPAWTGVTERNSNRVVEAQVPVLASTRQAGGKDTLSPGDRIGYLIVGQKYPSWWQVLGTATPTVLAYLGVAGLLGTFGSFLLARRVKRQTFGLEPDEIAGLVESREAMLLGQREGVVGLDADGVITLVNDEAAKLLGLPVDAVGRPISSFALGDDLVDLLRNVQPVDDAVAAVDGRLLVLNNKVTHVRGRPSGSVTTMRDRTELVDLQLRLTTAQDNSDTLRAQVHEFRNRLHTIAGLVEVGEYDAVVRFVRTLSQSIENHLSIVAERVHDPAVAALLVAKNARANELGSELILTEDSHLGRHEPHLSADLVTVVGNLIDNGYDAVSPGGGRIEIGFQDDGSTVTVRVRDSGAGVPAEVASHLFERKWSTKESADRQAHGWGLALASMACQRHHGSIELCDPGGEGGQGAEFIAVLHPEPSEALSDEKSGAE